MNLNDRTDNRDPATIEREIRETQAEMSRTVDQIEGQLTPRNVLNALLDKADEKGIDARYLVEGARRNPIALAMIALGGIWLVSDSDAKVSSLKPTGMGSSGDSDADHTFHRSYVEHMSRCERNPNEDDLAYRRRRDLHRASYLMIEPRHDEDESSFRGRLDAATESLRQRRDSMMDRAHSLGSSARSSASGAASSAQQAYRENPIIGGMIAALVGALAGAAAPISRMEEENLGPMGSQALDRAKDKTRELGEKAREKKDEAVDKIDRKASEGSAGTSGSSSSSGMQNAGSRQYDTV